MNLPSVVIAVGILVIVSMIAQYLRSAIANTGLDGEPRKQMVSIANQARWEKYGGVVWAMLLLVCGNQVFQQVQRGAPVNEIMFSFVAAIAAALACGGIAGRFLLRQDFLRTGSERDRTDPPRA